LKTVPGALTPVSFLAILGRAARYKGAPDTGVWKAR
jgi:hypothetical protein